MSDLEFFTGSESANTGFSPEKYQEFLSRMREAAAQIKELKKGEQRQKTKEDKLAKILVQFIKTQSSSPFANLIIQLLSKNLPPVFILALISIAFPEIRELTEEKLLENHQKNSPNLLQSLNLTIPGATLPLDIKSTIDTWLNDIKSSSIDQQNKINQFAHQGGRLLPEIITLSALSIEMMLTKANITVSQPDLKQFCNFALHSIIKLESPPKLTAPDEDF